MAHGEFLRHEEGRNVYELDCPRCGSIGEIGVPEKATHMIKHDCGALFLQKLTSGRNLYEKPKLVTVAPELE